MNIQQVMAELGRLHMENLALKAENAELVGIIATQAGPAQAQVSESESDPRDPRGPSEDSSPEQAG